MGEEEIYVQEGFSWTFIGNQTHNKNWSMKSFLSYIGIFLMFLLNISKWLLKHWFFYLFAAIPLIRGLQGSVKLQKYNIDDFNFIYAAPFWVSKNVHIKQHFNTQGGEGSNMDKKFMVHNFKMWWLWGISSGLII